jgi:hypothetical protein
MPQFDEKKLHDKAAVIYEMLLVRCDQLLKQNTVPGDRPYTRGAYSEGYATGIAAAHHSINSLGKSILPEELQITFLNLTRRAYDWAAERFGPDTDDTFSDGFHAFAECFAMILSDEE